MKIAQKNKRMKRTTAIGIASCRLMDFVKKDAREKGFHRVELDVWDFNDALGFYEAEGFKVYRRYCEWQKPKDFLQDQQRRHYRNPHLA